MYEHCGAATLVGTELLEADLLYTRYGLNEDFTRIDRGRGIDRATAPRPCVVGAIRQGTTNPT